jgi:lysylphosphatidylglycerol synthetase-like protein (DUF2156 family)
MTTATRPFGVTLLAILHVLQAILFFLGGIALIALGAFIRRGFFGIHRLLSGAASLIGVVVIVIGLLYLGLAWGLWSGKGWAWKVSLILAALGIIISLISLLGARFGALIVLILDAIIVYYLLTPHVRTFFGEYRMGTLPQQPTQPIQLSTQSTSGTRFCPNCGAPVQPNEKFCSHCGKRLA